MPLVVSVVINNYNYADFVGSAIASVQSQSYEHCQCIVVDDGSTDGSGDVIGRFSGVEVVRKENGGQSSAIRAGLERATGDVVIILDSDDQLADHAVERIAQAWTEGTAVLLYALEKRDLRGGTVGRYPEKSFLTGNHRQYCQRWGEFPASPMSGNAFDARTLRQLVAQIDDEAMSRPDGFLIYGACFFGNVTTLDEVLGYYLVHGKNASTSAVRSYRTRRSQLLVDISHRIGLADLMRNRNLADVTHKGLLSAHHWREIALMRKYTPDDPAFSMYSPIDSSFYGSIKYALFPGLPWASRLKNIALLFLMPILPGALVKGMFKAR